jgi:ABC-2 type transport system permease protein
MLQTLFMAGDIWPVILANSGALLLIMVILFSIARHKLRKRLD